MNYFGFKIHILYKFHKDPWGGGNQFLIALRKELINEGLYENDPQKADVILFNSHHNIKEVLLLKLKYQNKIFIHRIDGPLFLTRGDNLKTDLRIYELNNFIADGTIFQSEWSKMKNRSLGLKKNFFEKVIMNASDRNIFFPKKDKKLKLSRKRKWKLIAISWSQNFNKGFDLYQFLDNNLDFNQYSMKFVGNSPISFKNIQHVEPIKSIELASHLRESDIYITGSRNDPCSNSLIEALNSGLPCVVFNDGGHPEILKKGGETFNTFKECLKKIELIKENYETYKNSIKVLSIKDIVNSYIIFSEKMLSSYKSKKYKGKKLRLFDYYKILFKDIFFRISHIKNVIFNLFKVISVLRYNFLKLIST